MSSPVAPGDVSLDEIDQALDEIHTDDAPASTDPTPTAEADPPSSDAGDAPEPEATGETTAETPADPAVASAPDAALPDSTPNTQLTLPEGAQPFAFRVDGREYKPEGAMQLPDGSVLLPEKAWAQIRGGLLVDREAVNSKLAQARQQVQQARQEAEHQSTAALSAVTLERDQARAALEEFQKILSAGPDAVMQWAENFAVNRPALEARMQARALEVRLQQAEQERQTWQQQQAQATEAQQAEALRPQLEAHLEHALDVKLAGEFAGIASTPQEKADLRAFLWETMRGQLFYEDEQGIGFRTDLLDTVLGREKARQDAVAKKATVLSEAARRNAAATAPTSAAPRRGTPPPAKAPKAKPVDVDEAIAAIDWLAND